MKINKLKLWFALALVPMVYHSCDEKKLDILPTSQTEFSYFQEEADFERTALGVYAKLTDIYWYRRNSYVHGVFLLPGDDITTTRDEPYERFGNINAQEDRLGDFYRSLYILNSRAIILRDKVQAVAPGIYNENPQLKNYHMGEALFFKAYANYLLWNYFGTAPLINNRLSSTDILTNPNSKGTELLDQAIADFKAAAEFLPNSWSTENRGRVTKSSANGMLGKALVFRGTVNKNKADFSEALVAFNKINDRSLMPNFKDNFSVKKENNAESLFEYQASQAADDNVWLDNDFDNNIGSISAYYGYYEMHWSTFNQAPYRGTVKLYNAYEENAVTADPRRDATVMSNTADANAVNDYQIQKYWTDDQKSGPGVASVNNTRILRYADVLLLKAEAIVQSDGALGDAIALINQVRERARNSSTVPSVLPLARSTVGADKNTVMEWIRTERFLELAGEEGHRWLDLRRWHLGGQINLASGFDFSSAQPANMGFNVNKHLVYPIPTNEIDYNPSIVQNPNY